MKINLSVVDDHNLYRKGLIKILGAFNEVKLINEFEDGEDYINHLTTTSNKDADIVLLDYQMPKLDGISVCRWLKDNKPKIKPIIISQYDDQYTIQNFIKKGAAGYLLKGASIEELREAITEVFNNNFYFNEQFCNDAIIDLVLNKDIEPKFKLNPDITDREKEIARLICHQFSYKEIATKLDISQRTVETHKK